MKEKRNPSKTSVSTSVNLNDVVLVAGLGNPGPEYERTYHNVGLLAEQYVAGNPEFITASTGTFAFVKYGARIFIRPLVFMNESGVAIRDALRYFNLAPAQLIVLHDDADIPLGELKIQFGRGEAGHHGIESIARHIGTKEFWRARIGIEQKTFFTKKRIRAERYVLKPISQKNRKNLEHVFETIKTALRHVH